MAVQGSSPASAHGAKPMANARWLANILGSGESAPKRLETSSYCTRSPGQSERHVSKASVEENVRPEQFAFSILFFGPSPIRLDSPPCRALPIGALPLLIR